MTNLVFAISDELIVWLKGSMGIDFPNGLTPEFQSWLDANIPTAQVNIGIFRHHIIFDNAEDAVLAKLSWGLKEADAYYAKFGI